MIDPEVILYHTFFTTEESDSFYRRLMATVAWREHMSRFGRPVPRLTAFYGDLGVTYTYSGIIERALPWTPPLAAIKQRVEAVSGARFNTVLLNQYRHQDDSVAWHSDDEEELGQNPTIASVSLGAERHFRLRHKRKRQPPVDMLLTHGSLLIMQGTTQHEWEHCVPKMNKLLNPRINLTYRLIKTS